MNDIDAKKLQEAAFQIILSSGEGRALTQEAYGLMRTGDFEAAQAKLTAASDTFVSAHQAQTEFLHAFAAGEDITMDILMVHAQDHLMTGMAMREVAIEMMELYKRLD